MNPLISLMGEPVQLGASVRQGANALTAFDNVVENRQTQPMRMRQMEATATGTEQDVQMKESILKLRDSAMAAQPVLERLKAGDIQGAANAMRQRGAQRQSQGGDGSTAMQGAEDLMSGDPARIQGVSDSLAGLMRQAQQFGAMEGANGGVSGAKRTDSFKNGAILQAMDDGSLGLTLPTGQRVSPDMPEWGQAMAAATQSGIAYAGDIAQVQQNAQVNAAGPKALNAGAGANAADMGAGGGYSQADVERSISEVRNVVEAENTAKMNQVVYSYWDESMTNLNSALDEVSAGPIVGRMPAFTAAQQRADASGAAMVPALKALFRETGEGTFTKDDQESLLDMLGDRTNDPVARRAINANVDRIVRIKLGMPINRNDGGGQQAPPQGAQQQQGGEFSGFKVIGVQ
jgi:hypothetical protein